MQGSEALHCKWGSSNRVRSAAAAHSGAAQRASHMRCRSTTVERAAPARRVPEGVLTPQQVSQFHEQGYLVLPGFSSREEMAALQVRISTLLDDFQPATLHSVFSTRNQKVDRYFLDSASNISFFLEEKAVDGQGQLTRSKELSVNKIGHALHDLDPTFAAFSRSEKVAGVLASLGFRRPLPVQSMYIFKQPAIGGEVVPHQDSTFLATSPLSCVGLWWAVEDATKDNGCLWAQPGVHKRGLLRRFIRAPDDTVAMDGPAPAYELDEFLPLECPAGTLVLLHGENIHYSCENTSPVSRHSYSMHVVESAPGVTWLPDNWAHRNPETPWQPLYDLTA